MTTDETLACEALILTLLRGFPSSASAVSRGLIDSYVGVLSHFTLKGVRQAIDRYARGEVEGADHRFAPSAAELARLAGMFDGFDKSPDPSERLVSYPIGGEPPPGHVPLGPIEVAFEGRRIDMRNMDHRTKEFVLTHKRRPEPGELGEKPQIGFTPRFQRV